MQRTPQDRANSRSAGHAPVRAGFFRRVLFFVGWILSPSSFWNDSFVNIPLAYVAASISAKVLPVDFGILTITWYWITNGVGVYLMYAAGRTMFRDRQHALREVGTLILWGLFYSALLFALVRAGVVKPF